LCFSRLCYIEFSLSQRKADFYRAVVRALNFYGASPYAVAFFWILGDQTTVFIEVFRDLVMQRDTVTGAVRRAAASVLLWSAWPLQFAGCSTHLPLSPDGEDDR